MARRTSGFYGFNESLLASALAAIVFSLLSAQPLTIVGITGLISLFNYTIFDIICTYDVSLYPRFMVWTGIWAAVSHWCKFYPALLFEEITGSCRGKKKVLMADGDDKSGCSGEFMRLHAVYDRFLERRFWDVCWDYLYEFVPSSFPSIPSQRQGESSPMLTKE